jgi:hypothetical protein
MKTSLDFLDMGKRRVTLPLFCLAYLAPLTTLLTPQPNFSMYLHGLSGTYKSTLAVLTLCHFGTFTGVEAMSNFSDTVGILEKRSFTLKDSLHVVDDYHPSNNKRNAEGMESTAQRLIRGYSNRTARARLNADMTERGRYEPRGMMLMTAEELPSLESTLARVCVVSVEEDDIDRERLTALQENRSLLPHAMAAYITWVKENMGAMVEAFPGQFQDLRQMAMAQGVHRKLPEQAAFMRFALETALSFFQDNGMVTDSEARDMSAQGWDIFRQLAAKQQQRIEEDNPVDRFFDIIATLLHQHNARLEPLPSCDAAPIGAGDRLGLFDERALYLIPPAAWHAVQTFCQKEGSHFPFTRNAFFHMLQSKKIIVPSVDGKSTQVMKLKGKPIRVLKIVEGGSFAKIFTCGAEG